jgi:hypothetical protein
MRGLGEDRKRSGFMPSELLKRSHRLWTDQFREMKRIAQLTRIQ